MIVSVWAVEWYLDEDRRVLAVGDAITSWMTFEDAEQHPAPGERLQTVRGVARALPRWPGAEDGRHPVAIDVPGGTFYWDAPERVEGAIEVTGSISFNNVDAPDRFPVTHGVVRRVRMEWQECVERDGRAGPSPQAEPRYEDVSASWFPPDDRPERWTGCLVDLDLGLTDPARG